MIKGNMWGATGFGARATPFCNVYFSVEPGGAPVIFDWRRRAAGPKRRRQRRGVVGTVI